MTAIDSSVYVTHELPAALTSCAEFPEQRRRAVDEVIRMQPVTIETNPRDGIVVWSPVKSLWFTSHALVSLIGGYFTLRLDAAAFSCALTALTLCLGQSLRPNTRANVSSSTRLGVAEDPGWVWTQTRANWAGRRPTSIWASKNSATASSSNATVTGEHSCRINTKSSR